MTNNIFNGKRAVSIISNGQDGPFSMRVWVNCENGQLGDATLVSGKAQTMKGAEKWAQKKLAQ